MHKGSHQTAIERNQCRERQTRIKLKYRTSVKYISPAMVKNVDAAHHHSFKVYDVKRGLQSRRQNSIKVSGIKFSLVVSFILNIFFRTSLQGKVFLDERLLLM